MPTLGATGSLAARGEVLLDTGRHRVRASVVLLLAAAVLALPTLLVVLPWWAGLAVP